MIAIRLWHKDLIQVLPRQQLLSQWRECCCIAKDIAENGMPNHLLVNKIMYYPACHFFTYGLAVTDEMQRRGYHVNWKTKEVFKQNILKYSKIGAKCVNLSEIFPAWHNYRYFLQCYYNLQEKHDCGGIPDSEWEFVEQQYQIMVRRNQRKEELCTQTRKN